MSKKKFLSVEKREEEQQILSVLGHCLTTVNITPVPIGPANTEVHGGNNTFVKGSHCLVKQDLIMHCGYFDKFQRT